MTKVACRSSNLVYAITCKRCGQQYVGQTMVRLKDRFVGHLGDINNEATKKPRWTERLVYHHTGIHLKTTKEPGSHHYQKKGGEKLDTLAQASTRNILKNTTHTKKSEPTERYKRQGTTNSTRRLPQRGISKNIYHLPPTLCTLTSSTRTYLLVLSL